MEILIALTAAENEKMKENTNNDINTVLRTLQFLYL